MEKVDIILPVYNSEKYLASAINSILGQTFSDFNLYVIDDCSTDNSLSALQAYSDSRIKIVTNSQHRGISYSLNKGLSISKENLIFRMDADDISLPERLESQIQFMQKHPYIFACGSDTELIDEHGRVYGYRETKHGDQRIKIALFFGETSLAHPAVVMRASHIKKFHLQYSSNYLYAEDYELWCRCSHFSTYENISSPLIQYRRHHKSVSKAFSIQQRLSARKILKIYLNQLGLNPNPEEFNCHIQFALALDDMDTKPAKQQFRQWRDYLISWNRSQSLFEPALFEAELEQRYTKTIPSLR